MINNIAYGHGHNYKDCGVRHGYISLKTTANEVTTVDIEFDVPFKESCDIVIVSPVTAVPYTAVRAWTAY